LISLRSDGVLVASNLGDSGFFLIRDGEIAFQV
jgi:hypothetical protein